MSIQNGKMQLVQNLKNINGKLVILTQWIILRRGQEKGTKNGTNNENNFFFLNLKVDNQNFSND